MPAFDWRLEDAQVAAVLTYIRNNWGNAAGSVSASAVASQRASLAKSP
jgi:mono/diheme cytochrome c family protein